MKTLYRSKTHWNQYRSPSARAAWWDYGKNGVYFVTICTKHKYPFFGQILNGEMQLSEIGQIARNFWLQIPQMTLHGVHLEAFSIMPNHIHGVIVLNRPKGEEPLKEKTIVETVDIPSLQETPPSIKTTTPTTRQAFFKSIAPKKGSLSHIIRKFKGLVTKTVRDLGLLDRKAPLWQPRFYDRIVRTAKELGRITEHILEQPLSWANDDYHCPPQQQTTSIKKSPTSPPTTRSSSSNQTTTLKARCKAWWDKWQWSNYAFLFSHDSTKNQSHALHPLHWMRLAHPSNKEPLLLFRLNPI